MYLSRQIRIQLLIFTLVSVGAVSYMLFGYLKVPSTYFGVGRYMVTLQLPESAGLYAHSNVTYEGTEIGRVTQVRLTRTGVEAQLSLKSDVAVPSDLDAQVHSQSAVGEQYVALLPRNASAAPLRDGDVIPEQRASVPPNISTILDATNTALAAIPRDNLKTVIDEASTALGGLGPDLSRLVNGATSIAIGARENLDSLTTVIDHAQPVLDSQTNSAAAIAAWSHNVAAITTQLKDNNTALGDLIRKGGPLAGEVRQLLDDVTPTLPVLLSNLAGIGDVALTYRADLEQVLALLPQSVAILQAPGVAAENLPPGPYKTGYLSFNLNLNLPPPCTTGYLPIQQQRPPSDTDYPDRPAGDLYCRVPQDSPFNVRGVRNIPCETVPGKRAPTVKMCESNDNYVPLNDGENWKGDPNATLSGQPIPQREDPLGSPPPPAPPAAAAPSPLAVAQYDPATGRYIGPDGRPYTQANLAHTQPGGQTWQSMLVPPPGS